MKNLQELFTIDYIINFIPNIIEATSIWIIAIPTIITVFIFISYLQGKTGGKERKKWIHKAWNLDKIFTKKEVDKYMVRENENLFIWFVEYLIGIHLFFLFIVIYLYIFSVIGTSFEIYIHDPLNLPDWTAIIWIPVLFLFFGFFYFVIFLEKFMNFFVIPYLFITDKERLKFKLKREKK